MNRAYVPAGTHDRTRHSEMPSIPIGTHGGLGLFTLTSSEVCLLFQPVLSTRSSIAECHLSLSVLSAGSGSFIES